MSCLVEDSHRDSKTNDNLNMASITLELSFPIGYTYIRKHFLVQLYVIILVDKHTNSASYGLLYYYTKTCSIHIYVHPSLITGEENFYETNPMSKM